MRKGFYPRLAWNGIGKNKRMYLPYMLMGSIMVMMFYILSFLLESPALDEIHGGSVLRSVFPLGCAVIAVFSLLFLFYTHTFVMKQRSREWGLYHILGMDKRNLCRLVLWEGLLSAGIVLATGLLLGIALSKAAELILLNLLKMTVDFHLRIGMASVGMTAAVYLLIYGLLLLHSLWQVFRSKPLELMTSNRVGERKPKGTWLLALLGGLLLVGAYVLAVWIKEPVTALATFFLAVVMVILGTYLLMIAGSVTLCRLLQKNTRYYYRNDHFVSVAFMVHRMKRNGAGLASICILLTMVLVMLSSTATLYFGEEDALYRRYPNGVNFKIQFHSPEGVQEQNLDTMRADFAAYAPQDADLTGTRYAVTAGLFTEKGILLDHEQADGMIDYDRVGYLFVIPLSDYQRIMARDVTLTDEECLLYSDRLSLTWDSFAVEGGRTYRVKERLTDFREDGDALAMTMPSLYLVVKDLAAFAEPLAELKNETGFSFVQYQWLLGFDPPTAEAELAAKDGIEALISQQTDTYSSWEFYTLECRSVQRKGFFELYGSLFFLGILLSVVFLTAAVLMIYYKQIAEGYEDQSRFDTMQRVGMTKQEIRKTVHSQMLTVFFLPLGLAGVHLAFAFPVISKILVLFAFENVWLNASVTLGCFVLCGAFYAAVYHRTSAAYYSLVSELKGR